MASVDDSIAAGTATVDDDYAAALDNDCLLAQPTTPQLVERQLHMLALSENILTSVEAPRRTAAAIAADFCFDARDVSPLIMRC